MTPFRLASWNVKCLNKDKRKTIEDELKAKNVSIACLQETGKSGWIFYGSDYTFICSGTKKGTCTSGVAFAFKNNILNDRELKKRIDCHIYNRMDRKKIKINKKEIHIINVYAPVESKNLKVKEETDKFYKCLEEEVSKIPKSESVFIIGDFNAHVGADNVAWTTCLGDYGVGEMNDNGERLLEFCSFHNICVLNTYFNVKESERLTHQNQVHLTWSQVDLCLTRDIDRKIVTSANPVGELLASFDHKMVILEINMKPHFQVIELSEEIHEIPPLFRDLLNFLIRVSPHLNSWSEGDNKLRKVLQNNLKRDNDIEWLETSMTNIQLCFQKLGNGEELDQNVIKEIMTTIFKIAKFYSTSQSIMEHCEKEVKRLIMEYWSVGNNYCPQVISGNISCNDKQGIQDLIEKDTSLSSLKPEDRKPLKALAIKCCEKLVLQIEKDYLFSLKQCSEFFKLSISTECIAFVNTLSNSMKMFPRLESLNERMYTELQEKDIFKCKTESDMLFALNLLQEKCCIKNVPLFIAFVDISQPLQNINTNILVKLLEYGTQWHFNLPFLLGNNICKDEEMQKCEPLLMEFLLSHILHKSFNESEKALPLKYRYDKDLFESNRLNAETKTSKFHLRGIQYGNCAAIFAMSVPDFHKSLENLENTFTLFGLSYVQSKPVVIMQNVEESITDIQIGSKKVNISTYATFLRVNFKGGKFSHNTEILSRVHNACRQLYTIASGTFTEEGKLTKYKETILHILLENVDVLTLSQKQETYLEEFNARCLCRLKLEQDEGISKRISLKRLTLYSNYAKQEEDTISKRMLYGNLVHKTYSLSYVEILKRTTNAFHQELVN